MFYRHSEIVRSVLIAIDLALVSGCWLAAYLIRFHTGFATPLGVPEAEAYLPPLLAILPLWLLLFRSRGLYEPQRMAPPVREALAVVRATAVGVVLLVALSFFLRTYSYSRGVVAIFSVLSAGSIVSFRLGLRLGLRQLRRRGYNLRYAVVIGGGELARQIVERLRAHPESGLQLRGVLSDHSRPQSAADVPLLGRHADLKRVLHGDRIDQVIVALDRDEHGQLEKVLADLDDEVVSVRLVPDLLHVLTVGSSVETIDGLPMINLRESPMVGWAAVQKRVFDIVLSGAALVIASPVLAAIAFGIRWSSGSPIFDLQQRMGLDGRVFEMIKFRTMRVDAEAESGPVWASEGDERCTRFGAWLRRYSLDELPQLWNVVRGDMSMVGPRPERLHFIEEFKREIPGYMLRHKVKAGLTGWAQVHGWRGNTSLHERIEHDLYYMHNWSLELDVRILALTLARGFRHDNAY